MRRAELFPFFINFEIDRMVKNEAKGSSSASFELRPIGQTKAFLDRFRSKLWRFVT